MPFLVCFEVRINSYSKLIKTHGMEPRTAFSLGDIGQSPCLRQKLTFKTMYFPWMPMPKQLCRWLRRICLIMTVFSIQWYCLWSRICPACGVVVSIFSQWMVIKVQFMKFTSSWKRLIICDEVTNMQKLKKRHLSGSAPSNPALCVFFLFGQQVLLAILSSCLSPFSPSVPMFLECFASSPDSCVTHSGSQTIAPLVKGLRAASFVILYLLVLFP